MTRRDKFMQFKRPEVLYALFAAVTVLPGIGDKIAKLLEKRGITHVVDLLRHLPVGLIDRSRRPRLGEITEGDVVTLEVKITRHEKPPRGMRQRPWQVLAEAVDGSGTLAIVYFHVKGDYVEKLLPVGQTRIISGRAEIYREQVQIPHPDHVIAPEEIAKLPRMEPVYPLTAGLTPRMLARAMQGALKNIPALPEWISDDIRTRFGWQAWDAASAAVHAPQKDSDLLPGAPARMRLAFDELLANQLALGLVRNASSRDRGRVFKGDGRLRAALRAALPFALTDSQKRVIAEINAEQESPHRMLRLVQGDVGAGKTPVALDAMLAVVEAGAQAVLLAPTEILARQHHATLTQWLKPLGIAPVMLTGKMAAREKTAALEAIKSGEAKIITGTHALLSDSVEFADLGIGVVDEQHRFGVRQRLVLGEKGDGVDVLVMTATPIPRSLAMTAYGDLALSKIDEKPAGRGAVKTTALDMARVDDVIKRLVAATQSGRSAYWICPLVDESDAVDIAAAIERHAMLRVAIPDAVLVHGRMDSAAREEAMEQFRTGQSRLLVATTVIEVGVDVREASIMVIEHAERFGLAQMHQLRGRIGRGETDSNCLLLYKSPLGAIADARIKTMCATNDGFKIAEEDLRLRGPGEILGSRQSGDPDFILADLAHHGDLLALAAEEAAAILARDPALTGEDGAALRVLLALFERDKAVSFLAGG